MSEDINLDEILNDRKKFVEIAYVKMKNLDIGESIDEVIAALNVLKDKGCTHVSHDDDYLRRSYEKHESKEEIIKHLESELKYAEKQFINTRLRKETLKEQIKLAKNLEI